MSEPTNMDNIFNKAKFADLLKKALGNRTQTQFSKDCKISNGYICLFLNKKASKPPTPATIQKMASAAANGIKFESLMHAAGYTVPEESLSIDDKTSLDMDKIPFFTTIISRFTNVPFQWILDKNNIHSSNFEINITDGPIKQWNFHFIDDSAEILKEPSTKKIFLQRYYELLCSYPKVPDTKFSFVTDSVQLYNELLTMKPSMLAMYVSLIHIDPSKNAVIKEQYLDSYFEINEVLNTDYKLIK